VRRVLQAVVVALGVATFVFVLVHLLPGDQAHAFLGQQREPQLYPLYDDENGLTQPLSVQYLYFLLNLLHGRLAFIPPQFLDQPSFGSLFPVDADLSELVTGPLPETLLLVALGYGLALAVGVPGGAYLALRHGRGFGRTAAVLAYAVYATPIFVVAIVLSAFFERTLPLLPVSPARGLTGEVLADPLGLVLPVVTLAFADCVLISRYLQSTTAGVLIEDYVRAARAKGGSDPSDAQPPPRGNRRRVAPSVAPVSAMTGEN
jgi:peptide/nickel transport system permease protein